MTNKLVDAVKTNRKAILKKTLIVAAVITTVIVVGALYKANVDASEALALAEDVAGK